MAIVYNKYTSFSKKKRVEIYWTKQVCGFAKWYQNDCVYFLNFFGKKKKRSCT